MNNEPQIKQFLFQLAEMFPGTVTASKLELYYTFLKKDLSEVKLKQLLNDLVRAYEFFPSVKQIADMIAPPKETRREKATAFVDQMIALLQGRENVWEFAGADNYNFWKKEIGVFRADLVHIKPQFHRNEWIDRIERAYVKYDIEELERLDAKKEVPMIEGQA